MPSVSWREVKAFLEALELGEKIKPFQVAKRRVFAKYKLLGTGYDRLFTALMYKMARMQGILDRIIEQYTRYRVDRIPAAVRQASRLAVYLAQFDEIGDRVLADIIIKHTTRYIESRFRIRDAETIEKLYRELQRNPWKPASREEELELKYLLPMKLIESLEKLLGQSGVEAFAREVNNPRPVLGFRVNRLKTSIDYILEYLSNLGVEVWPSKRVEYHVSYRGTIDYSKLEILEKGLVVPQDEASTVAGYLLGAESRELVADLCAAPGGKTTHLAELSENEATIVAVDIYSDRLERLLELAKRTGTYTSIYILEADSRRASQLLPSSRFDRVIVDPPCSSTGALLKEPEARWRLRPRTLKRLVKLQQEILREGVELLKPGGRLLYSVCSILPEEGEKQVEKLLESRKVELVELDAPYDQSKLLRGTLRSWPHIHKTTGFFYALLEKKK